MPIGDIAPALILTVGSALTLLVALFLSHQKQWICSLLALATLSGALFFTIRLHLMSPDKLSFSDSWALDGLTAWSSYGILGTTILIVLLSPSWMANDRRHGEWYVILMFSALGAILMAGAADLMELMVAMLLSSVTGYTLASYHRASRICAEAGAKYYFIGALANPIMFIGIVLFYALAADTAYNVLADSLLSGPSDPVILAAGLGLLLIGLAFKLGAVPAHPWVPDVTQGSPAPAAAFLTIVPKIGALAALTRLVLVIPDDQLPWRLVTAIMAAVTMSIGNLAAIPQTDVRRLLGWSSVSQIGYGLMAVVAIGRTSLAEPALVLFFCGYAIAQLCAFAVVISLRGRTSLEDYQGLSSVRPWHAATLTLALLSLTGIPPLIGFAAKLALFAATLETGFAWLAVVAVLNTVISIFYYLRVISAMYLKKGAPSPALLDSYALIAVFGTAVLILGLGLGAQMFWGIDLSILPTGR